MISFGDNIMINANGLKVKDDCTITPFFTFHILTSEKRSWVFLTLLHPLTWYSIYVS